jgi:hypothetical protein
MPPVFGKEIRDGSSMADTSNTGIGFFDLRKSDERILQSADT